MTAHSLEQTWLQLTRVTLPSLSASRNWPVREDHCFQRILLDAVCGGVWYDHVKGQPAYRRIDIERLAAAVALGERIAAGEEDLRALNARSLAWRRERGSGPEYIRAVGPVEVRGQGRFLAGRPA